MIEDKTTIISTRGSPGDQLVTNTEHVSQILVSEVEQLESVIVDQFSESQLENMLPNGTPLPLDHGLATTMLRCRLWQYFSPLSTCELSPTLTGKEI